MWDTKRSGLRNLAIACLFATITLSWAPSAFGQTITTGDVTGVVSDATGAVVPNATVTLKFTDTNDTRTATTNGSGQYRFSLLRPGEYTLADLLDPSSFGITCSKTVTGGTPCFTASQFSTKATQTGFGNSATDIFRGAGYFDIDANITKNFPITDRARFTLGAQMYNLLNHPNFADPSGSVTSSALGFISATVVPRLASSRSRLGTLQRIQETQCEARSRNVGGLALAYPRASASRRSAT